MRVDFGSTFIKALMGSEWIPPLCRSVDIRADCDGALSIDYEVLEGEGAGQKYVRYGKTLMATLEPNQKVSIGWGEPVMISSVSHREL